MALSCAALTPDQHFSRIDHFRRINHFRPNDDFRK